MTTSEIKISNYEKALTNADYISEALENSIWFDDVETNGKTVEVNVSDVSMTLASGYGTWKVSVTLEIMGQKKVYSMTHHNEDWYLSQKIAYDSSVANSEEEYEEAMNSFQSAFEAVIDYYADDIVALIDKVCEEEI